MGTPFGTPVPVGGSGPSESAAKPNGPTPSTEVQDIIDENDPRLVSEALDVNLEGDAYAQPAPPPDGKYRVKLKLEGVKVEGSTDTKPYGTGMNRRSKTPYFKTNISCTIIDPKGQYDGIVCYPAFGGGVNTDKRRDGTTQVTTILTRLVKADGSPVVPKGTKYDQKGWIELFVKTLAGEPEIGAETAWEASCMACGEEMKKAREAGKDVGYATRTTGMHHFPQETDAAKRRLGQLFSPEIKCAANPAHGYSRARAIVSGFLSLADLEKK
jgi:hypothetical protein